MSQIPTHIKTWLNQRGITDQVIEQYDLGWNEKSIIIPVHDRGGNFLFNKYRKDPMINNDSPKYTYDKGSKAALFGLHQASKKIKENEIKIIYITEGELDCLRLVSEGLVAISSTGGSGTFLPEWSSLFKNGEVRVCYDNDEAGLAGMFKVLKIIPHAMLVFLPESVGEGGDITDFYQQGGDIVSLDAVRIALPEISESLKLKTHYNQQIKDWQQYVNLDLMKQAQFERNNEVSDKITQAIIKEYLIAINELKRQRDFLNKPKFEKGKELQAAKKVSLDKYLDFNRQGFARCLWHNEKTNSMFFYRKNNSFYCFGCHRRGDVIDVVQKTENLTFSDAIDFILGDNR